MNPLARAFLALTSPLQLLVLVLGSWRGVFAVTERSAAAPEQVSDGSPFVQARRQRGAGRAGIEPRSVGSLGKVGSAIGALIGAGMIALAVAVADQPAWQWTLFAILVVLATLISAASVLTLLGRRVVVRR